MDLCAYRYKAADDPYDALMTIIMIKVGGNSSQLFDDGDLNRETLHTSSIERDSRLKCLYN